MCKVTDSRGTLTVCQWDQHLPFVPRRTFFLHGVPNEAIRGEHAHKECVQVLVCVSGSVAVALDDGSTQEEYVLDNSNVGLLIPPAVWAAQYQYSAGALVAVFASHNYDADDYIRDYDAFLEYRSYARDSAA